MIIQDENLINIIKEMQWQFLEMKLEVALIPQSDPPNVGACIRIAINSNAEWYRKLCSDFPSHRKTKSRKFKTAVKRKSIEIVLQKLTSKTDINSKYADWIIEYANYQLNIIKDQQLHGDY